ncbi:hypothetical protein Tsubulata_049258 [Turnera subulata]|uniref:Nucleolar complex protein 2 homolog n=1 Tax=Turnera subulata TaxID=218843 RepID=A0A9Q0JHX7_9ROSI|nr:hypothetical protein Tsubulata_049258 [Turnera subulata]
MGKLGKKARKFAKKNLQSVQKRQRKLKSVYKKRAAKRDGRGLAEDPEADNVEQSTARTQKVEDIGDVSLEDVFDDAGSDIEGDDSDSDGFLSEDENFMLLSEPRSESQLEENSDDAASSVQNKDIRLELEKKRKRLSRLKEKDPKFSKFLETNSKRLKTLGDEENFSDEDGLTDDGRQSEYENDSKKLLNSSAVDSLCQVVMEQHNVAALTRLLNGYRAACHYGSESSRVIKDSGTFSKILMFVLCEVDGVFRKLLGISGPNDRKDIISELKNSSNGKILKPLVKSYLRSSLFLLNEVTDSQILGFALTRLRASTIFFAAFPSLLQRLLKVSVHLWAKGEGTLSQHSFLILQDVAAVFNKECFDKCLITAYKAFIGHCKFMVPTLYQHLQFLKNSFVELCSQDVPKSSSKAVVSIQQLAKILQLGLHTKKEEAVKKLCSWQYAYSIDLWVEFISANVRDYDLQPLLYMMIQIINGVAVLFPGPRYLPLRVKCVQWLNHLSSSSGIFIPVASLALDILEYKIGKESSKPGKDFSFSTSIKLPKHWLKSRSFQEECVSSVIELLATHFAQWSYHISFPELATISLINLRKFQETTAIESSRRGVKRFVDQVEQNVEFIRKKRDEVAFSPNNQQSADSFLQFGDAEEIKMKGAAQELQNNELDGLPQW